MAHSSRPLGGLAHSLLLKTTKTAAPLVAVQRVGTVKPASISLGYWDNRVESPCERGDLKALTKARGAD